MRVCAPSPILHARGARILALRTNFLRQIGTLPSPNVHAVTGRVDPPPCWYGVGILLVVRVPVPGDTARPSQDQWDDLTVDHHLAGVLLLSPPPPGGIVGFLSLRHGTQQLDELAGGEGVALDATQEVVDDVLHITGNILYRDAILSNVSLHTR
jgi:hypothetical protein